MYCINNDRILKYFLKLVLAMVFQAERTHGTSFVTVTHYFADYPHFSIIINNET